MNVSLEPDGLFTHVCRFLRRTGVLLFIDALLSLTALAAVLVLLASLAKAAEPADSYQGTFKFDADSGYPARSPYFDGSYDPGGFVLIWDGDPGSSLVREVILDGRTLQVFYNPDSPDGNRSLVTGGTADKYVFMYGGMAASPDGASAAARGNLLVIAVSAGTRLLGGQPIGGFARVAGGTLEAAKGTAEHNTLVVDGAYDRYDTYYGGFVDMHGKGAGTASHNTLVLLDVPDGGGGYSEYDFAAGGAVWFSASSGADGDGSAVHNILYAENSFLHSAYGGAVWFGFMTGAAVQNPDASYNRVFLVDSRAAGNVAGGWVTDNKPEISAAKALYNTVALAGETSVTGHVRGGVIVEPDRPGRNTDYFEGNTLDILLPGSGGVSVGRQVANFQTLNFLLSADAPAGSPALRVGQAAVLYETGIDRVSPLTGAAGERARETRVGSIDLVPGAGGEIPEVDDEYLLMAYDPNIYSGTDPPAFTGIMTLDPVGLGQEAASGSLGDALDVAYALSSDSGTLKARVTALTVKQRLQAATAAAAGTAVFVGQGLELLSDSILSLLTSQGQRADSFRGGAPACPRPGFTASAGRTDWPRDGRLRSSGRSGLLSLGCARELSRGTALAGVFIEGGEGSYSYEGAGKGAARESLGGEFSYGAAGLFARYDFPRSRRGRLYLQGAFTSGTAKTTFEPQGGSLGEPWRSMSRRFAGGSLEAGFIAALGRSDTLDLSVRHQRTRLRGGSFLTGAGDRVDFEPGASSRTRASAVWSRRLSGRAGFHFGLAADHEGDGRNKAYTYGMEIPSPSMRGTTASVEAGGNFRPGPGSPWSVTLAVQGYTGVRRGGAGFASLQYSF
ncbi:MAG: hypothetical protein LBW85_14405 [Deltaproteobacteria bacterium]|jgi:hypothetical protein|nr:hypothetical protein [Deltaproteobacteria bacterium]